MGSKEIITGLVAFSVVFLGAALMVVFAILLIGGVITTPSRTMKKFSCH